MRRIFSLLLLCASLPIEASAQTAKTSSKERPLRIAVFNSRVAFESMPERIAAESALALEQAKARTMLNTAADSLRGAVDEFTRSEGRLTPRQREAATMHLRARELMVEEMAASLDEVIFRRNEEILTPLRLRMRAAIRDLRERERYDLIVDVADDSRIVEADPRIDITDLLVRLLRTTEPNRDTSAVRAKNHQR